MQIGQFPFRTDQKIANPEVAAKGYIALPPNAKIIHFGADHTGRIFCWAEVSDIETPAAGVIEAVVLCAGQKVPEGYMYRTTIMANPMLFVYQRMPDAPEESRILLAGAQL